MVKHYLLLFLFATGLSGFLQAQDPQFIQFYNAPLLLNPAMTGVHPGKWRVIANYRTQWNSILDTRPYRSLATSFDMKMPMGRNDFLAVGFSALRDQAGLSEYLRQNANLSVSYLKQLGGGYRSFDQYLIGALQAGFGQHSLQYQNLWFSSQFDLNTEQVNQNLPNGEALNSSSGVFADISAGLMWYAVFADNQSLYVGGALHHVNRPKVSFNDSDGEESMDSKWVLHAGGEIPFSHQFSILPAATVMGQGKNMLAIYGLNFRYTNRDWKEVALRAGIWGHLVNDRTKTLATPAITFTTILEMERWNIGISYDVGANQLAAPTNGRGAVELSLIYYHPGTRRIKVNCPKL